MRLFPKLGTLEMLFDSSFSGMNWLRRAFRTRYNPRDLGRNEPAVISSKRMGCAVLTVGQYIPDMPLFALLSGWRHQEVEVKKGDTGDASIYDMKQ